MARKLTEEEQKVFSDLKDAHHGMVKPFLVQDCLVVVKAASPGDLHRYKDKVSRTFAPQSKGRSNTASVSDAERELAFSSIVYPDREKVRALFESQPGFIGIAASAADDLAQSGVEELDLEGN